MATKIDKYIHKANKIAANDTVNFDNLKTFAEVHPRIMMNILKEYKKSPDIRFGDTLLIFCSLLHYEKNHPILGSVL
jgi:hypothetical protein